MTHIISHHDPTDLPRGKLGTIPVLMYGHRPPRDGTVSIGGPVLASVRRLGVPVHRTAFDLLTVAMAVTAADTFVDRRTSADGWARELSLKVPLYNPIPWEPVVPILEEALNFLSGDLWTVELLPDGPDRPTPQVRGRLTRIQEHDCASLFSGGMDSTIGVLDLITNGRRPVLVSHSYRGDAERQRLIHDQLPSRTSRFSAVANPLSQREDTNDVQMRTRSFNFIAYGALIASTMAELGITPSPVDLFVPENGLIALNPPLTYRRIGSLSTRTTHPHFLGLVQRIFEKLDLPVRITNPYEFKTKGEMVRICANQEVLRRVAEHTVSCGKWKRTGMQCGRCVPCLIRRASFHAAGINDQTKYASEGTNLTSVLADEKFRDDLLAMILAAQKTSSTDFARWVPQSGPLPSERTKRDALINVVKRGMEEVSVYLRHFGLIK